MATNQNNMGFVTGRLVRDISVNNNSDGSKKVKYTIAAQNNFKGKDGKRGVAYVPIDAFIPAGKDLGVHNLMHKGDLVSVEYTVTPNNYTDKEGKAVYGITLLERGVELRESKAVTDARAAKNAAEFIPDEAEGDMPFAAEETAE